MARYVIDEITEDDLIKHKAENKKKFYGEAKYRVIHRDKDKQRVEVKWRFKPYLQVPYVIIFGLIIILSIPFLFIWNKFNIFETYDDLKRGFRELIGVCHYG